MDSRPLVARTRWLLVCVGLVLATAALGQSPPMFDYREVTLDNGLRVLTLEDFSCPIVAVQVWYHVGSKNEDPQRQGFAHMFEHMMFRGTELLGDKDPDEFFRRSGGDSNAYTSFDQTVYHETLPANQLDLALWIEAERMAYLKIDQDAYDTERKVVEEERRMGLNRPYGTLFEKGLDELFKVHPYRWSPIGKIPHLRAAAVSEVRDFWTRNYVPNNATLVIVGAVKHEEAQALARKYLGWIPRGPDLPPITVREPAPTESRSIALKEDNAPTPVVAVAYHTVPVAHDDAVALELLASILGGGDSSRLYRELVAEKQLAVAAMAAAFNLEQAGLFVAGAALTPTGGDTKKVMSAIGSQMKRLREEPVSERELLKARNQMLAELVTGNLYVDSKASALGSAAVLEGDAARVNRRLEAIRKVTADDLMRVAKAYMGPGTAQKITVDRNLLGMVVGKRNPEEDAPITAEREEKAPPPGRPGVQRPADFPRTPPLAGRLDFDTTIRSQTAALPNGLKLVVVENHEVPYVSMNLGLKSGAWTESRPGTASMALSMLTKGTSKHSEAELAEELETYAISLGGSASLDAANVEVGCLTEHVERAMGLLAEVVGEPTFPEEEFSKLRKQVLTSLTISNSEPSYVADRELRRRIYGEHPYSRTASGEVADVRALDCAEVAAWWRTFARPEDATLLVAGDISLDQARRLAETALGGWAAAQPRPALDVPKPLAPTATQIYLVDRPGEQAQIRIGRLGITRHDPGYFTSRVVTQYFGGAFNSRLNEKIRVEKGLTYGAGGGFRAQRFLGQFTAATFSKVPSTVEAVRLILGEIERLRTDPPSEQELGDTKAYTLGSFASDRETPGQVATQLWTLALHDLPADYYEKMLAAVDHTQAEDCVRFAKETIDPGKLVIVVVGPASSLKADLEQIAPVTVVPWTADQNGHTSAPTTEATPEPSSEEGE